MVKNFYLFRHGQSTYNLEGRIQGHANNSVLTDKGIEQAYGIASTLRDKKIELVLSSPLRRARQTSSIISKVLHIPIHFDDALAEANLGTIEGMSMEDAKKVYSDLYAKWLSDDLKYMDVAFDGGESKKEVRKRIFNLLDKYAHSEYENLAVSGHGTIMVQSLLALGVKNIDINHGEIVHLQHDNGHWKYIGRIKE